MHLLLEVVYLQIHLVQQEVYLGAMLVVNHNLVNQEETLNPSFKWEWAPQQNQQENLVTQHLYLVERENHSQKQTLDQVFSIDEKVNTYSFKI